MSVVAVEHTCHDVVSCFVKCVCGNWWQSSHNMTWFPVAYFYVFTFSCFSVSLNVWKLSWGLNCMNWEHYIKFKFYFYIYIYIYLVCTMLIIYHWDNYLRFWCRNIWNGQKLIMSWNFIAVRQEILLRGKPVRRTMSLCWSCWKILILTYCKYVVEKFVEWFVLRRVSLCFWPLICVMYPVHLTSIPDWFI